MTVYKEINTLVERASLIVITSHRSPDGDSIGSSMGLFQVLRAMGKNVVICHPDPTPSYLHWVPEVSEIIDYDTHTSEVTRLMDSADLIFCLDYNEPSRLGESMGAVLLQSASKKIMIDHHLNPAEFTTVTLSDTSSCSTCQLIFDVVERAGWISFFSKEAATALYLGIMTDTGSFRFPSVQPRTHEIISELLKYDIRHALIHEAINDVNTLDRLRLKGYACSDKLVVNEEDKYAYITLTKEELQRFNYQKGDTEGLVNTALSIVGMRLALLFQEHDDYVKISFRSKGIENAVNVMAATYFHGGGHANASGGKYNGSIEAAVNEFKRVFPEFFSVVA
jgi:phosphoesterase RecJ-like protein